MTHDSFFKTICAFTFGLIICSIAVGDTLVSGGPSLKVTPAAPPRAQAFSLHDVRLLDGEFKTGQDIATAYLLSVEADRLLAKFRKEAGLPVKAPHYGGWEGQTIAGHSAGHYLSACSLAWASTGDKRFLERVNYIVSEFAECQRAGGDGYIAAFENGRKVYGEVAAGDIRSAGFDLNGIWVPNYTMHKVLAGLRDAYRLAENKQALDVACKLADWLQAKHAGLTDEQMQKVLACEHGGMNEVLADLYADTGDEKYLKFSRQFHHKAVLEPLARGEDILPGKHANTQIPKLVGLATRYELTGDMSDRAAADFFWDRVVHHHSYVTGGHCDGEYFGQPNQLNNRLSTHTTETCNVNNMLKLTEHVFGWNPDARVADFYERALLNHIRATQHPDGRVIYNLSLKPGHHKEYQALHDHWTCCVGTGMENHVKYGAGIYYHDTDSLWVNLFIASEVDWKQRGVTLRQETKWPDGESTKLTLRCEQAQEFTLRVRRPFWARACSVKVNGRSISVVPSSSGYFEIKREWKNNDVIDVSFPNAMRIETMPDNPNRIAVFNGPVLLAADLGRLGDPKRKPVLGKYEDGTPVVTMFVTHDKSVVPVLLANTKEFPSWVEPVKGRSGVFKTRSVGRPFDVELVPFHRLHDHNYTVYLDVFTEREWKSREADYKAQMEHQRSMEARTVDFFQPGEMQPERDHNVQGDNSGNGEWNGRKFRHAWDGGWFSFTMKVDSILTNELVCSWWGGETGKREFDILVNDTKIATQKLGNNKPGEFWDATYQIPVVLTSGRSNVTVKLQALPGNRAGGLFGSRMLRNE